MPEISYWIFVTFAHKNMHKKSKVAVQLKKYSYRGGNFGRFLFSSNLFALKNWQLCG